MSNAIDLGNAAKVSRSGDSSNYPDTVLSGCADPTDFNNGTKGDGGDVVSAAAGPAHPRTAGMCCCVAALPALVHPQPILSEHEFVPADSALLLPPRMAPIASSCSTTNTPWQQTAT